jgi:hypothetical protein
MLFDVFGCSKLKSYFHFVLFSDMNCDASKVLGVIGSPSLLCYKGINLLSLKGSTMTEHIDQLITTVFTCAEILKIATLRPIACFASRHQFIVRSVQMIEEYHGQPVSSYDVIADSIARVIFKQYNKYKSSFVN